MVKGFWSVASDACLQASLKFSVELHPPHQFKSMTDQAVGPCNTAKKLLHFKKSKQDLAVRTGQNISRCLLMIRLQSALSVLEYNAMSYVKSASQFGNVIAKVKPPQHGKLEIQAFSLCIQCSALWKKTINLVSCAFSILWRFVTGNIDGTAKVPTNKRCRVCATLWGLNR